MNCAASADQRDLVVHREQLVVHSTCQVPDTADVQCPRPAVGKRIEDKHLDVRMGIQRSKPRVEALRQNVVEQETNLHTGVRRAQERVYKNLPDDVVVNQEVLRVDRSLGEQWPQSQRIDSIVDRVESGLPGMFGDYVADLTSKVRVGCLGCG